MIRPRAITVCVEYDDFLDVTLPHTLRHVDDLLVVTSPEDKATAAVCAKHGVRCHKTSVFYADGAEFNKGAAMEEGFDILGREGWMLVLDSDIVIPERASFENIFRGFVWGCQRVIIKDPWSWGGELCEDVEAEALCADISGYFQLFHADDVPRRPWYPTNYRSAATVDQWFCWKNFPGRSRYIPFQRVLHLGRPGDWCGRTQKRRDGSVPADAAARRKRLDHIIRQRLDNHPEVEFLQ
jgi:hypothetical protein